MHFVVALPDTQPLWAEKQDKKNPTKGPRIDNLASTAVMDAIGPALTRLASSLDPLVIEQGWRFFFFVFLSVHFWCVFRFQESRKEERKEGRKKQLGREAGRKHASTLTSILNTNLTVP